MQSLPKLKYVPLGSPNDNTNNRCSNRYRNSWCTTLNTFRSILVLVFSSCLILQLTFCLWNTSCSINPGYIYIAYGRQKDGDDTSKPLAPIPIITTVPVVIDRSNNNDNNNDGLVERTPSSSSEEEGGKDFENLNSERRRYKRKHSQSIVNSKPLQYFPKEGENSVVKVPTETSLTNSPSAIKPGVLQQRDAQKPFLITKQPTHHETMNSSPNRPLSSELNRSALLNPRGYPSNNIDDQYWPNSLKQSIPTKEITMDRLSWYIECLQVSRYRPYGQSPDYHTGTGGAETFRPTQLRKDYYRLKYMAFTFYKYFDYLWNETHPDAPPQADWGFYAGPWIEEYWRYTFGRPVRRTINIAEWQFQVKLMGSDSVRAITMPAEMNEEELLASLSLEQQNNYSAVLTVYNQMEGHGIIPTVQDTETIHDYNLPMVEVEELFDYDLFFPYVPLFIPWERISIAAFALFKMDESYYGQTVMMEWLYKIEKQIVDFTTTSVAYITLAQRAQGIILHEKSVLRPLLANTLVINAGGGGDIPIPLLANEQPWLDNIPTFGQHRYWISFIGSPRDGLRNEIIRKANERYGEHNESIIPRMNKEYVPRFKTTYFPADALDIKDTTVPESSKYPWIPLMGDSMLQLTPRGINPTSFRLYEALQMGLIPVYIYDNERPWLPYYRWNSSEFPRYDVRNKPNPAELWHRIGYVVHMDDYDRFLDSIPLLSQDSERYNSMREAIREARDHYFTYDGVIRQIYRMLVNPRQSEMTCSIPSQLFF